MGYTVYLAGEIHSPWRDELRSAVEESGLPIQLVGPVTDHAASDDCGALILGEESNPFWRDRKGAGVNAVRTRVLLQQADVVVVKFGEKYRQWNAAFDAGFASALPITSPLAFPRDTSSVLHGAVPPGSSGVHNSQSIVKRNRLWCPALSIVSGDIRRSCSNRLPPPWSDSRSVRNGSTRSGTSISSPA